VKGKRSRSIFRAAQNRFLSVKINNCYRSSAANKLVTAVGTISPAARITGRFRHPGNGFSAALSKENRDFPAGMLSAAYCAWDRRVSLAHWADGFEHFVTFLADILINWHFTLGL
jgi:hypothetical protein